MSVIQDPDRNLALELVRVTETAAVAAAPWVGRGEKNLADQAAVEAMRKMINTVDMSGAVHSVGCQRCSINWIYCYIALGPKTVTNFFAVM